MTYATIRQALTNGDLSSALQRLLQIAQSAQVRSFVQDLIMLSGSNARNEQDKRMGMLSLDNYRLEFNRLHHAALFILDKMEREVPLPEQANLPKSNMPNLSNKQLSELLNEAFATDEDFQNFCFAHFEEVYGNFASNQSKQTRIMKLIDYCKQRLQIDKLLQCVAQERPAIYSKHFGGQSQ